MLKHVGVRPSGRMIGFSKDLKEIPNNKYELLPLGGYRMWSSRMLRSGCNKVVSGKEMMEGLIYCKYCDEFFNANQFKECDE